MGDPRNGELSRGVQESQGSEGGRQKRSKFVLTLLILDTRLVIVLKFNMGLTKLTQD